VAAAAAGERLPALALPTARGGWGALHLLHATLGERRCALSARKTAPALHQHDVFHVVLFTAGDNQFLLAGRAVASRPGTLALVPPGMPHDFGPLLPGESCYSELTFHLSAPAGATGLGFAGLLAALAGQPEPAAELAPVADLAAPALREGLGRLTELVAALAEPAAPERLLRVQLAFLRLAQFLLRERGLAGPGPGPGRTAADPVVQIQDFLERHFAEPLSVAGLAARANLSAGHLQREFKRRTGLTLIQHLHRTRIHAARNLLRSTSLSAKEIAGQVGFQSAAYFSRLFRRHTGLAPAAARAAAGAVAGFTPGRSPGGTPRRGSAPATAGRGHRSPP